MLHAVTFWGCCSTGIGFVEQQRGQLYRNENDEKNLVLGNAQENAQESEGAQSFLAQISDLTYCTCAVPFQSSCLVSDRCEEMRAADSDCCPCLSCC